MKFIETRQQVKANREDCIRAGPAENSRALVEILVADKPKSVVTNRRGADTPRLY
jgi:hypothetical protein